MKKHAIHTIICTIIMLVFGLSAIPAFSAKKGTNTFAHPDFAFPVTVTQNAKAVLKSSSSPLDKIKAAIQIAIASNSISNSGFSGTMHILDSLAATLPAPYAQAVYSLQAQAYAQYYNGNRFQVNQRVATSVTPTDIAEWSRDDFARKVISLVKRSLDPTAELAAVQLSFFAPILDGYKAESMRFYPSVYDLLALRGMEWLQPFASATAVIPFGMERTAVTPAIEAYNMRLSIADKLLEIHSDSPYAVANAVLIRAEMMPGAQARQFVRKHYDTLSSSAASLMLVVSPYMCATMDNKPDTALYHLAVKALERYPSAEFSPNVKNLIASLTSPNASLSYPGILQPGTPVKVHVEGRNVKDLYILLVKLNAPRIDNYISNDTVRKYGKVVESLRITHNEAVPFVLNDTVMFKGVDAGSYVVLSSSKPDLGGASLREYGSYSQLRVGTLSALTLYSSQGDSNPGVYVVHGADMTPAPDVKVSAVTPRYYKKEPAVNGVTDKDGYMSLPSSSPREIIISAPGEKFSMYMNPTHRANVGAEVLSQVLTDLSIYHPADTVRFAVITYTRDGASFGVAPSEKVRLSLVNPNGEEVDTLSITTDADGRIESAFRIPDKGVTGNFAVVSRTAAHLARATVVVADYKAPTFFVETDSIASDYKPGGDIIVTGKAQTYSGMPLAGAEVELTVTYMPNPWARYWSNFPEATYGTHTITSADGSYRFVLPTGQFAGTAFEHGVYKFDVTATTAAGETQCGESRYLTLGTENHIEASVSSRICLDADTLTIPVRILNAASRPVSGRVNYTVVSCDGKRVERQGVIDGCKLLLSTAGLVSGRYVFNFSLEGDTATKLTRSSVLYRNNDERPPVISALWVTESRIEAHAGVRSVSVKVGNSYPGASIMMIASDANGICDIRRIKPNGKNIKVSVPTPTDTSVMRIRFIAMHDFATSEEVVEVVPSILENKLAVEVETFRNNILPGTPETWRFRISNDGRPVSGVPIFAVMTDKALNVLEDFKWSFAPSVYMPSVLHTSVFWANRGYFYVPFASRKYFKEYNISVPMISTYGKSLYSGNGYGRILRIRGGGNGGVMYEESVVNDMKLSAAPAMASADVVAKMEESADEVVAVTAGVGAGNSAEETSGITYRGDACPIAYFYPYLKSDAEGYVEVSFVTPDFNTSWQYQMLAYNDRMQTVSTTLTSVASKPVMVQNTAPRFLRTSDGTRLCATLYNNTDATASLGGRIEVINPLDGKVLAYYDAPSQEVVAKGSRVISLDFRTPDDVMMLAVRCSASTGQYTDGEQTLVSVLPSSSPVFESQSFYIGVRQDTLSIKLPEYTSDANVSLQYCDNPVWYCVTALPDITRPESDNLLTLLDAWYGNALSANVVSRYPEIREGLRSALMSGGDTTMVISPLSRDAALKIISLDATIWSDDAESETLRLRQLSTLLDTADATAAITALTAKISALQCPDGGWQWMPGMKPSLYLTSRLLYKAGMLKSMKALPTSAEEMILRALAYCDEEVYADYKRNLKSYTRSFPTEMMMRYFYIRSFFPKTSASPDIKRLQRRTLSALRRDWRKLDINGMATAAILLYRSGDAATARVILSSVGQHASSSPSQGMWFDNLRSAWNGANTLLTTTRVLMAYSEITPAATEVDALRQWLVLQRQVQSWGGKAYTSDVVYAILCSSTNWTSSSPATATVTLDGRRLSIPRQSVSGSFTIPLSAVEASGATLTIIKGGEHPSWGGVVSRCILPVTEVKAASIPLSIRKQLLRVVSGNTGQIAIPDTVFAVGDMVRISLTVTTDRDIEYVAITDEGAACLAVADQLPGYMSSEGVWYYREPRSTATNFFIDFLPKGTHIITYDCYVQQAGTYASGIATAQSQYAPVITAHSNGSLLQINVAEQR